MHFNKTMTTADEMQRSNGSATQIITFSIN